MNLQNPQDDMDVVRLRDIISQFADIIFLLCSARKIDARVVLSQFTNLSDCECSNLHLPFKRKGI